MDRLNWVALPLALTMLPLQSFSLLHGVFAVRNEPHISGSCRNAPPELICPNADCFMQSHTAPVTTFRWHFGSSHSWRGCYMRSEGSIPAATAVAGLRMPQDIWNGACPVSRGTGLCVIGTGSSRGTGDTSCLWGHTWYCGNCIDIVGPPQTQWGALWFLRAQLENRPHGAAGVAALNHRHLDCHIPRCHVTGFLPANRSQREGPP